MPTHPDGPVHSHAQLDLVIRNTCANVAIILTKTHNTQVEVQELRKELAQLEQAHLKCLRLLCELLDTPEAREHAAAVLKDFALHKNNPK